MVQCGNMSRGQISSNKSLNYNVVQCGTFYFWYISLYLQCGNMSRGQISLNKSLSYIVVQFGTFYFWYISLNLKCGTIWYMSKGCISSIQSFYYNVVQFGTIWYNVAFRCVSFLTLFKNGYRYHPEIFSIYSSHIFAKLT